MPGTTDQCCSDHHDEKDRLHALVLPFPIQGHISPLLQLSEHLASSHGFLITFVNTEYNHNQLKRSAAVGQCKNIKMVGISDGLPVDAERTPSDMGELMQCMPVHMRPLLQQFILDSNAENPKISCIIADIFMPWVHPVAKAADVPVVLGFHASTISQFSLIYHIPLLVSSGQIHADGSAARDPLERVRGIPGKLDMLVGNIPWCSSASHPKQNEALFKFLTVVQQHLDLNDAILFNSCFELESRTLDALAEETDTKMLPVGPLLLHTHRDGIGHDEPSKNRLSTRDKECLDWLDGKAKGSVLYISFGTTAWLSTQELHELALGLEASQVPFLWVLRSDLVMGGSTCLPDGFLERTKGYAYFTSWAPQTLVLSHPSVGAFLAHGGWNSTLEAICMGVPILTWPYGFDQKGNCQQIIEDWKVGLPLRTDGKVVERQEVEKLVTCIMNSEEGKEIKARMATLKTKARLALAKDLGSSFKNLQNVIQCVAKKSQM